MYVNFICTPVSGPANIWGRSGHYIKCKYIGRLKIIGQKKT